MFDVKDTEDGSEAAGAASLAGPRRRLEKKVSAELGRMGRGGGLELTNAQGESGGRGRASTSARVRVARWLTQRTHGHREHTQVRDGASYRTRPASAPCRQRHSRLWRQQQAHETTQGTSAASYEPRCAQTEAPGRVGGGKRATDGGSATAYSPRAAINRAASGRGGDPWPASASGRVSGAEAAGARGPAQHPWGGGGKGRGRSRRMGGVQTRRGARPCVQVPAAAHQLKRGVGRARALAGPTAAIHSPPPTSLGVGAAAPRRRQ